MGGEREEGEEQDGNSGMAWSWHFGFRDDEKCDLIRIFAHVV